MIGLLLAVVINLSGVSSDSLRVRAFFDINNVKLGDQMVLTLDFIGKTDFSSLHPPAIRKALDAKLWRLDSDSARTDTFPDGRRITWRIQPIKEGVLWFPELEFSYLDKQGQTKIMRANTVPVHVMPGEQVVEMDEMKHDLEAFPEPDPLITAVANLSQDDDFAWRRALRNPSADAFAKFDFPEAKLNEATMAIRAGDYERALGLYSALEWTTGQTPAIERGIIAALALKYKNPAVELPIWRQVGRPLLQFSLIPRVLLLISGVAFFVFLFWFLSALIKRFAVIAFIVLPVLTTLAAPNANDPFKILEEAQERMRQQMQQMQSFSFSFGGGFESAEAPEIKAELSLSTPNLQVGEAFDFIVSLEYPAMVTVRQIGLTPSQQFGLRYVGEVRNLPDGETSNSSNIVKRLAIPVRYDVPFNGEIAFMVSGMVSGRQTRGKTNNRFTVQFSNSFQCETKPIVVSVKPLSSANQPDDFSGIIADNVQLIEHLDLSTVGTNDVITLTYTLRHNGYVPADYQPKAVAFEWTRDNRGLIEWKRYFVADGAKATPIFELVYFEPKTKAYKRLKVGGTNVRYQE